MNCLEVIKKHLEEIGADGLYCNEGEACGCPKNDLAPCDSEFGMCKPGFLHDDGLFYPTTPGNGKIEVKLNTGPSEKASKLIADAITEIEKNPYADEMEKVTELSNYISELENK